MPGYHKMCLPEGYRALLDLPPAAFAWEWLRRNSEYRSLWSAAPVAAKRASAHAVAAGRRDAGVVTVIPQHPLGKRSAHLGLTFPAPPETTAIDHPLLGWSPEFRIGTITLVRPVAWARSVGSLRFTPARWGRAYRLEAKGGAHLLIRRHGAPEISFWLPAECEPEEGERFGLYVHPDRDHAARIYATALFRRAIGMGPPLRVARFRDAHRQATMLAVHDAVVTGTALRDIARTLLPIMPSEWRTSSERSDLRRLQEATTRMSGAGYRSLLCGAT